MHDDGDAGDAHGPEEEAPVADLVGAEDVEGCAIAVGVPHEGALRNGAIDMRNQGGEDEGWSDSHTAAEHEEEEHEERKGREASTNRLLVVPTGLLLRHSPDCIHRQSETNSWTNWFPSQKYSAAPEAPLWGAHRCCCRWRDRSRDSRLRKGALRSGRRGVLQEGWLKPLAPWWRGVERGEEEMSTVPEQVGQPGRAVDQGLAATEEEKVDLAAIEECTGGIRKFEEVTEETQHAPHVGMPLNEGSGVHSLVELGVPGGFIAATAERYTVGMDPTANAPLTKERRRPRKMPRAQQSQCRPNRDNCSRVNGAYPDPTSALMGNVPWLYDGNEPSPMSGIRNPDSGTTRRSKYWILSLRWQGLSRE
ncbi:hypothetical protein DFH09DRAFT_1101142 [Mycena vulgaris]|nr:hypothetical protein DFH09DRAFT_1101142 [Mycena vulgaris]